MNIFDLNINDFDNIDIDDIISKAEKRECIYYYSHFFERMREFEGLGDLKSARALQLLGAVASLIFQLDSTEWPFGPIMVLGNSSTATLPDFSPHIDVLKEIGGRVQDPEFKGRIVDVVWELDKKNHQEALIAVDSYIACFENSAEWVYSCDRVERAIQIAATLGKDNKAYQRVIKTIIDRLDALNGNDDSYFSDRLMRLLQQERTGDYKRYASVADQMAEHAEKKGDWHKARTYWEDSICWYRYAKDDVNLRDKRIRLAETFVSEANFEKAKQQPRYLAIVQCLNGAIEAYRRISDCKKITTQLHRELVRCQKKSMHEFATIKSPSIDLSLSAKHVRDSVSGKEFIESLNLLAYLTSPPKISDLREEVEKSIEKSILRHLIPSVIVDQTGKITARKPFMLADSQTQREAAMIAEMFEHTNLHRQVEVIGAIEPAREKIREEHNFRIADFATVVQYNPFIPKDRERIFAEGLYHGLKGNFLLSLHILIPQFENSIRYCLEQLGETCSAIEDDGTQKERDLNTLFYEPYSSSLNKWLGEDTVFDLKGLLVEKFGSNLRNRFAHGLMSYEHFYCTDAIYLWWIILRICIGHKNIYLQTLEKK